MNPIEVEKVQQVLEQFKNKPVFIHLETTNGAYASHFDNKGVNVGAYIRNAGIKFSQAKIIGENSSYRVGLKTENGWVYAEGLTDWEMYESNKLLLAGHDPEGRLMVALQISETPFN
ncbi:YojF family protein [Virgibacillus sp. W0181]|uniref:YojF family protein n=1 Tax=Virgibacillus sp. W0181 TaxID=3391581 RepID=UPI003F468796